MSFHISDNMDVIDRLGMRFLLQYNKDRFCSIVYLKNVIIMVIIAG